jgi:hypothetical protein
VREPEVQHLDQPARGQHHVPGLEIAVDDPALVGGLERFRDLGTDVERLGRLERPARQPLAQRLPFHPLQHERERSALVLFEAVDDGDVGVVERGEGERLAPEAHQAFGILRQPARQHLERHLAAQALVASERDFAHSARAKRAEQRVVPEASLVRRHLW